MGSPYVFDYRGEFRFDDVDADLLWDKLTRRESYPEWWPWMHDLAIRGTGLEPGAEFDFVVFAPIPYRMRLTVRITESVRPTRVEAEVHGHLRGNGTVRFRDESDGTSAEVSWSVEVVDRAMRVGARVARPLIKWGQDWAIRVALRNFKRHLIAETSSKWRPER
jgi:hypothetical protein